MDMSSIRTGLTSVTFRALSISKIVQLAAAAGLDGIEWGGDIHVPAGDIQSAVFALQETEKAGLEVLSYGSYYHGLPEEDFSPVLESAKALQAPIIRVWAGTLPFEDCPEETFQQLVLAFQHAADQAKPFGIDISFEYHRGTLTQTKEGALALLKAVNRENVFCYWQPNPDISREEQLSELDALGSSVSNLHVFCWTGNNERHPLSEGENLWRDYFAHTPRDGRERAVILEFVENDSEEAFFRDAETLKTLAAGCFGPASALICNSRENRIFDAFDDATLQTLRDKTALSNHVVTPDELAAHPHRYENTEYLFSTWGMPVLTEEEIRRYFPALKAVFYAAGSVQAFARPFLHCGVQVFSAWAANAVPVAEYTLSQILLANKGFFQSVRKMKPGCYAEAQQYAFSFPGNYRCQVGILGAGMIGSMVLEGLKAYDVETLVYDPFASDEKLEKLGARRASLEEIFSRCQTISNHIANLPATQKMLRYEHFSRMLPNAVFLNTGRGAQVVEEDLIRALQEEPGRTAVLDVTLPEPPEADSPLWKLENVVLTPHIAGSSGQEVARMGAYMQQEFFRLLAGQPVRFEVTEKLLETMA